MTAPVLEIPDLAVGETVGVAGESGSGKSGDDAGADTSSSAPALDVPVRAEVLNLLAARGAARLP